MVNSVNLVIMPELLELIMIYATVKSTEVVINVKVHLL